MNVMICFEVSSKQDSIRKGLSSLGYMSSWKVSRGRESSTYFLPSNSMWKKGEGMSPAKAKEDLRKVASQLNVEVLRAIALSIGSFDGVTGTPVDSYAAGE